MAEDWAADVKKYAPDADDTVIAAIVRYCGIALQKRDSSLVSFNDPEEVGRVRENFLKKKLGLTQPDEVLDQAIVDVGKRMDGSNFKNRVTVYYLLLERFGLLHLFGGKPAETAAGVGAAAAVGAGAAALGAANLASASTPAPEERVAAARPQPVTGQIPPSSRTAASAANGKGGGVGWWPWALLALVALGLVWWLFFRNPAAAPTGQIAATPGAPAVTAPAVAPPAATTPPAGVDLATAPAEGSVAIPTGAGVTTETRAGIPVVKVYFDTGRADVAPAFAGAANGLKAYLDQNAGSRLAVSGFNDRTGNAALNAELSKNRAEAVKADLVAAGVPDASVELVKPAETTDTTVDNASARRVEVVVIRR